MLGAIAGDVIGSIYEWDNITTTFFRLFGPGCRFTDDTVLTVAVADALLSGEGHAPTFKAYYRRYPRAGYGGMFLKRRSRSDPNLTGASATARRCGSARSGSPLTRSRRSAPRPRGARR